MCEYTIALVGNPNVGKSTVFNALTGADQHVGNWPGKTVERRTGLLRLSAAASGPHVAALLPAVTLVDLPGAYSLSAYSLEEEIARSFIVEEHPHLVIDVIDASNLERNLYLTAQLLETGAPLIIVLNMQDQAEGRGVLVDAARLSQRLGGTPVVSLVARRGEGIETLRKLIAVTVTQHAGGDSGMRVTTLAPRPQQIIIPYPAEIEGALAQVEAAILQSPTLAAVFNPRWLAIQLLEGDETLRCKVAGAPGGASILAALAASRTQLTAAYGEEIDVALVNCRYEYVHQLVLDVVEQTHRRRISKSDRLDRVVTHPVLGIPIFLALMWVVFKVTIDVSAPLLDWISLVVTGPIANWTVAVLSLLGLGETWFASLAVEGVIAGVGSVLAFVPVMLALYLVLAMLEDCGYMARAAMVMDRLMRKVGLQGKSFLPMVVGFGCSVPAIYATRTLDNQRDRILTGLLAPFMSCSARLPVYVLFAAIFFPQHASLAIFAMYLLGIVVAVAVGLALSHTLFKQQDESCFIMELPPYRLPVARNVWRQMWGRTSAFIRNAWTIILTVSVVLWFLLATPARGGEGAFADVPVEESLFGVASAMIAPIFTPAGFGSWQATGALLSGFVAKEVVIATLTQVYHVAEPTEVAAPPPTFIEDVQLIVTSFVQAISDTLKSIPLVIGVNLFDAGAEPAPTPLMNAIRNDFAVTSGGHGALAGLAFMIFVLLYTPCMTAVAAERHELGTKWMWVSVIGQFAVAWLIASLVFQVGRLLM
ncbi:MAG TPA: ferrous iron transport protein B [Chloroflexi bacterium]|nr:ferrous iron transport protein B [Chloroflexota bacterium]HHW88554.1 ferrous iron transport protein B [Chloroflexota bacterium]